MFYKKIKVLYEIKYLFKTNYSSSFCQVYFYFNNFTRWYEYSSKLDPRNSWPYNQLAKLAYRTQRYLQCCYYYIRSASTDSNPVLSARDDLKAIFNSSNKLVSLNL